MKKINLVFISLILLLFSCDSSMNNLGEDFKFGYINIPQSNNVYYKNVGLIDNETIFNVKWNEYFILVITIDKKLILIDKEKIIISDGFDEGGIEYVNHGRVINMKFTDSMLATDL